MDEGKNNQHVSFFTFEVGDYALLPGLQGEVFSNAQEILAGKDKTKEGEVIEIDRSNNRAKVKDLNMIKKHVKTTKEKKGGIFSKENFIHISNLKLVNEKKKTKKTEAKK